MLHLQKVVKYTEFAPKTSSAEFACGISIQKMRKTNIEKGNNINAGRLPQRLLPEGANPWKDPKFVEAYDHVARVVNEMPRNPQIEKAIKNVKPAA